MSLAACERPRQVSIRVSVPGLDSVETPVPKLQILALPYDRDSLLVALKARATTPHPGTAALDSVYGNFRGPFVAFSAAVYRVAKLRDTVAQLDPRLDSLRAGTPEYEALRAYRARVADSLRAAEARRDRARRALDSARATSLPRTDSLRQAIHAWEDSTYRDWDSIVRVLVERRHHQPIMDTTDATGRTRMVLPPGRWWISARAWDVRDPNAEWYWNVSADADTVVLSSVTGHHQPRY